MVLQTNWYILNEHMKCVYLCVCLGCLWIPQDWDTLERERVRQRGRRARNLPWEELHQGEKQKQIQKEQRGSTRGVFQPTPRAGRILLFTRKECIAGSRRKVSFQWESSPDPSPLIQLLTQLFRHLSALPGGLQILEYTVIYQNIKRVIEPLLRWYHIPVLHFTLLPKQSFYSNHFNLYFHQQFS